MDFGLNEQQQAIADLAEQVFRDHGDDARIRRIFESDDVFDDELWRSLGDTGLLAAIVPDADGGTGLGMVEFGLILEARGRDSARCRCGVIRSPHSRSPVSARKRSSGSISPV